MKKIINTLSGIFIGILPIGGAIVLSILIYATLPNRIGIAIALILTGLAFWLGWGVFKKVKTIGPIAFISIVHATPDLDKNHPKELPRK
ncbi:MAG: hypothetical protein LAT76_06580 [Schleiferiaceae bacterium]|nr:hypothetical protein [Schleiferiaceae bacterium]